MAPTARRARLPRPDERRHTDGRSGLSVSRAGSPPDFTRPDQPAARWRVVEHLAYDQLGQPSRLEALIPLGAHGELVRDESAERARVEVLGVPGGQPRACPIASPARPAARPVSLVDHRVPPDRVTGPPAAGGPLLDAPWSPHETRRRGSGPKYLRTGGEGRIAPRHPGTRLEAGTDQEYANVRIGRYRKSAGVRRCRAACRDQWGSACEYLTLRRAQALESWRRPPAAVLSSGTLRAPPARRHSSCCTASPWTPRATGRRGDPDAGAELPRAGSGPARARRGPTRPGAVPAGGLRGRRRRRGPGAGHAGR